MNTTQENTAKYVPRVIQYENYSYVCFLDEKEEEKPTMYYKFGNGIYQIRDMEKPFIEDRIYKISPTLYFRLSCELREAPSRKKYNLNKLRHELNSKQ